MKLLTWELGLDGSALTQTFTPNRNVDLHAVRPHLLIVGAPAGTITMEIQDASGKLIKASTDTPVTITTMKTLANSHGFFRFVFDIGLQASVPYKFVLKSSGYSYAVGAYVGWCSNRDLKHGASSLATENRGMEFWATTKREKGVV